MNAKDQRSSLPTATQAPADEPPTTAGPGAISRWLEAPPISDDPAAERRRQAEELVDALGGREALERLHATFLIRLHRTSNDWAATEGLRVTLEALKLAGRPG